MTSARNNLIAGLSDSRKPVFPIGARFAPAVVINQNNSVNIHHQSGWFLRNTTANLVLKWSWNLNGDFFFFFKYRILTEIKLRKFILKKYYSRIQTSCPIFHQTKLGLFLEVLWHVWDLCAQLLPIKQMSEPVTYFCTAILTTIYAEFFIKHVFFFIVTFFDTVDRKFLLYF